MARGISCFRNFTTKVIGGQTHYYCGVCGSRIMQRRGNALGGAAKCKAAVKKHIELQHPNAFNPDQ